MRIYVDTSMLVAAHVSEPHTSFAQNWLSAQAGNDLILSAWTLTECESAMAIKVRRGELDIAGQAAVASDINAFVAHFVPVVLPTEADYQQSRQLCRHAASGLRAGDALHLAVALRLEVTHFATLDQVLADNALVHGLETIIN